MNGNWGGFKEVGEKEVVMWGEITWDIAIGSFVYNVCPLIAEFLQSREGHDGLQAGMALSPWGRFHHEEGAPTLLFLIVASEHSASDESQSESPN